LLKGSTVVALVICAAAVVGVVIWDRRTDRVLEAARAGDALARWRVGRGARIGLVLSNAFGLAALFVVNGWFVDWHILGVSPLLLAGLALGVTGAAAHTWSTRGRAAASPPKPYRSGLGWLAGWAVSETVVLTLGGRPGMAVALGLAVGVIMGLTPALWRLRPGWGAETRPDAANQGIERTP
jgi:hypothetical protein